MIGLIIAAGKQSRFKQATPKALVDYKGQCLVNYNINLLKEYCDNVYVVVANHNYDQFKEVLDDKNILNIGVSGLGSGHAIYAALSSLPATENVIICWGDTILSKELIKETVNGYKPSSLGVPVKFENKPYVCFSETLDKILVYFSKYGDIIDNGYHDCSIFIGDSDSILNACEVFNDKYFNGNSYSHKHGNEFEFLDIFNETDINTHLIKLDSSVESKSFNTVEELNRISNGG